MQTAVRAAPADRTVRGAYADYLLETGRPARARLARLPADVPRAERAAAERAAQREMGVPRQTGVYVDFEDGVPCRVYADPAAFGRHGRALAAAVAGPVELRLRVRGDRYGTVELPDDWLDPVLESPAAARVGRLELAGVPVRDVHVERLAGSPALAGLTGLRIDMVRTLTPAAAHALAGSRNLRVLREFAAYLNTRPGPGWLGGAELMALAHSPYLRRIERLSVSGCQADAHTLLAVTRRWRLTGLDVGHCPADGDELVTGLSDGRAADRLTALGMYGLPLTQRGAERLILRRAFPRLTDVQLGSLHRLPPDVVVRLRRRFGDIR